MSVGATLGKRKHELGGRPITAEDAARLETAMPAAVPGWLLDLLRNYPLAGSEFSLREEADASELGAEMRWLTPDEMVSEAVETFPGIAAVPFGYLPVAMCLEGSGDPYFIRVAGGEDPPLVRIPHEAVDEDGGLRDGEVEVVCRRLSEFFKEAEFD